MAGKIKKYFIIIIFLILILGLILQISKIPMGLPLSEGTSIL